MFDASFLPAYTRLNAVYGFFTPETLAAPINSMTFVVRILRFFFWVLIVSWGISLLRRLLTSVGVADANRSAPIDVPNNVVARKLLRDPVCGMHVAENLALMERSGGQNVYFCSEDCRNKFLGEPKKFVANA